MRAIVLRNSYVGGETKRRIDDMAKNQTRISQGLGRKQMAQSERLIEGSLIQQLLENTYEFHGINKRWGLVSVGDVTVLGPEGQREGAM